MVKACEQHEHVTVLRAGVGDVTVTDLMYAKAALDELATLQLKDNSTSSSLLSDSGILHIYCHNVALNHAAKTYWTSHAQTFNKRIHIHHATVYTEWWEHLTALINATTTTTTSSSSIISTPPTSENVDKTNRVKSTKSKLLKKTKK